MRKRVSSWLNRRALSRFASEALPPVRLDRRQFLVTASTAAVAAGPVAKAATQASKLRKLTIEKRTDSHGELRRVTITTASGAKWEIDLAAYAGKPSLALIETPDLKTITLRDARLPGTRFAVAFTAEIRTKLVGHEITLSFVDCGVAKASAQMRGSLEDWIEGRSELTSKAPTDWVGRPADFGALVEVELRQPDRVAFTPQNAFVFASEARIEDLPLRGLSVAPIASGALRARQGAATVLSGHREGDWRGFLSLESEAWRIEGDRSALNVVRVDLHENGEGAVALAGDGAGWRAQAHDRVSFDLAQPRFVKALGRESGTAVEASVAGDGWLSASGVQLQLSPTGDNAFFASTDGRGVLVESPDLRVADMALNFGDDVSTLVTDLEGQVRLDQAAQRPNQVQVRPGTVGQLQVNPFDFGVLLSATFKIEVTRREDMLSLRYEFVNLALQAGGNNQPRLVRANPQKAAYVIVTFPPQSVTEQLVRENDPPQAPPDIRPGASRMAGPTRLVFFIPSSVTPLFSLAGDDGQGRNGLLDWDAWSLSIVPTAVSTYANNNLIKIDGSFNAPTDMVVPKNIGKMAPAGGERPFPAAEEQDRAVQRVPVDQIRPQDFQKIEDLLPVTPIGVDVTKVFKIIPTERMAINPRLHTKIEIPTRLYLSPNETALWVHSTRVKTSPNGKTEIWHTQLGTKAGNSRRVSTDGGTAIYTIGANGWSGPFASPTPSFPTVRAVDALDYDVDLGRLIPENAAQDQIMTRDQRKSLVDTMTCRLTQFDAPPISVRRLMLTPLGGWLKSFGNWSVAYNAKGRNEYPPLVTAWTHVATMARDHYVRIVTQGYLYPTGHPAAKIELTERKFQRTTNGKILAINRKRTFIVVRKPLITYTPAQQRELGFKSIRLLTLETPPLKVINNSDVVNGQSGFFLHWIITTQGPVNWVLRGEDVEGRAAEWTMRLIYVSDQLFVNPDKTIKSKQQIDNLVFSIRNHYDGSGNPAGFPVRWSDLEGQKLAFAPDTDGKPATVANSKETTTYSVDSILFSSVTGPADLFDFKKQLPPWRMSLLRSKLNIPAVAYMAGKSQPDQPVEVSIAKRYVDHGFDAAQNTAQMFLTKARQGVGDQLKFPDTSKTGGLLNPDMIVSGFAKGRGPVGGVTAALDQALPTLFPSDLLPDTGKILGAVRLLDLIPSTIPLTPFEPKPGEPEEPKDPNAYKSPLLMIVVDKDANGLPTKANVIFKWLPEVKSWPATGKPLLFCAPWSVAKKEPLYLFAKLSIDLKGGDASFQMVGTFKKFGVDCIGPVQSFIKLTFEELKFEANDKDGMKITLNPKWPKTEFLGPLTFVQKLLDIFKDAGLDVGPGESALLASTSPVPYDGLTFKPFLDVSLDKIRAGFTLGIPNIGVGVLSILNMSLSAEVILPILGDNLRVRFAFCERESPFRLSVMGFAGGGFISITVSPDDIEILEASFEFGGNLSLDIGVASGGISLMAGIYFKLENKSCLLEGYVKLQGRLSVLGLIKITITFELSLTYTDEGGNPRAFGTATVTVEVEVLFFSASVSMTVQRQFAGAKSSGGALMANTEGAWAEPKPLKFTEAVTQAEWATYCGAFA